MAIDTAAKRSSCLDHEEVWSFGTPLPDGTVGQGDRQHAIWTYSGLTIGGTLVYGPLCVADQAVYVPGVVDKFSFVPGVVDKFVYVPGIQDGEKEC